MSSLLICTLLLCCALTQGHEFNMTEVEAQRVDCLTEAQKEMLASSLTTIQQAQVLAQTTLTMAGLFATPEQRAQLDEVNNILTKFNGDLLGKLTDIYEASCGTCQDITRAVAASSTSVKDMITTIVPDWRTNPTYVSVTTYIDVVLAIAPTLCPTELSTELSLPAPALLATDDDNCLTEEQKAKVSYGIRTIQQTLVITQAALRIASINVAPETRDNINTVITILESVDDKLISKMEAIINETCGTCTQIIQAVTEFTQAVKDTLTSIQPDWQTNPTFVSITTYIDVVLALVPTFCPVSL